MNDLDNAARPDPLADMAENCVHLEYRDGFEVSINGGDWFRPAGQWGRGGIMPKVARKLIADGLDESTPIRATRAGTKIWKNDHPLSYWAGLSISEGDYHSVKAVAYVAMPKYWSEESESDEGDVKDEDDGNH